MNQQWHSLFSPSVWIACYYQYLQTNVGFRPFFYMQTAFFNFYVAWLIQYLVLQIFTIIVKSWQLNNLCLCLLFDCHFAWICWRKINNLNTKTCNHFKLGFRIDYFRDSVFCEYLQFVSADLLLIVSLKSDNFFTVFVGIDTDKAWHILQLKLFVLQPNPHDQSGIVKWIRGQS